MNSLNNVLQEIGKSVLSRDLTISYEEWKNEVRPLTDEYLKIASERVQQALPELEPCSRYSWRKHNKSHDCFDRIEWKCSRMESLANWPGDVPRFFLEIGNQYYEYNDVFFWGIRWWGKGAYHVAVKEALVRFDKRPSERVRVYNTKNANGTTVALVFRELRSTDLVNCESDFLDEIVKEFTDLIADL